MKKGKNNVIASFLAGTMILGTVSYVNLTSESTKIVFAESKALSNAKAKISHLTTSIKTNYLGIKNQVDWQRYIKEARELIKKIPNAESKQKNTLTIEVDKAESLVNSVARINQVEKSIINNYNGIKNAETWNEYLNLAKVDLEKVDKTVFKKQYDELVGRMNKADAIVKSIENDFQIKYDAVVKSFNEAKKDNDKEKAKTILEEAKKLGTCFRSDSLEFNINRFINGKESINFNKYTEDNNKRYDMYYPDTFKYRNIVTESAKFFDFENKEISVGYVGYMGEGNAYQIYNEMKSTLPKEKLIENITDNTIEVLYVKDDKAYYRKYYIDSRKGHYDGCTLEFSCPVSELNEYRDIMEFMGDHFSYYQN